MEIHEPCAFNIENTHTKIMSVNFDVPSLSANSAVAGVRNGDGGRACQAAAHYQTFPDCFLEGPQGRQMTLANHSVHFKGNCKTEINQ